MALPNARKPISHRAAHPPSPLARKRMRLDSGLSEAPAVCAPAAEPATASIRSALCSPTRRPSRTSKCNHAPRMLARSKRLKRLSSQHLRKSGSSAWSCRRENRRARRMRVTERTTRSPSRGGTWTCKRRTRCTHPSRIGPSLRRRS